MDLKCYLNIYKYFFPCIQCVPKRQHKMFYQASHSQMKIIIIIHFVNVNMYFNILKHLKYVL